MVTCEIKIFFQPSSKTARNNFILARGNLPEIILKLLHMSIAAHEYFPASSVPLK